MQRTTATRGTPRIALGALAVLALVPVWSVARFPSQDGPTHLESAAIARWIDAPDGAVLRDYYVVEPNANPSWLVQSVFVALGAAGFAPRTAERLLVSAYALLLPLAAAYALAALRPGAWPWAVLILPFVPNVFLHLGFYNFCLSLALWFALVGFWLRHADRFGIAAALGFGALALATYFAHAVSFAAAGVAIGALVLGTTAIDLRDARGDATAARAVLRRLGSRALLPFLAALPALAFLVWFLRGEGTASTNPSPFMTTLRYLAELRGLVSYRTAERWPALVLAAAIAAAALVQLAARVRRRDWDRRDALLGAIALTALLAFVAPDAMSGGWMVDRRLTLYPWFLAILWVGARPLPRVAARALASTAVAATIAATALHFAAYREIDAQLTDYLSGADRIEAGATILPLCFARAGRGPSGEPLAYQVAPFLNAAGHIAAERPVVDLANWQADRDGLFPVRYRPERNPLVHLARTLGERPFHTSSLSLESPEVDFAGYPRRTGGRVDYVLVWGLGAEPARDPATQSIRAQLASAYELVHTSPSGLAQLYRRKPRS